uniref:Cadherin domain-containing protein n=1 Tax=Anas platyrhynchos TaxID=8839 RepID=A0A8B9R3D8_ANAPL
MGPTLVFQNLVYQVEVSEATPPGAQILQIQAHSLNPHGVTSKLTYSLESSTDSVAFGIRADTGWIYLRKYLNYEYAQLLSFRALVSTSEDENSMQNASTSVIVNVLDENDNSPVFMPESYFFKLEENPVPRGVVGTVTAVDKDSGRNGQLLYFSIAEDVDDVHFELDNLTGDLFLSKELDYETASHFLLQNSTVFLKENVPVGTLVYTFNAKDGDGSFLNSKIQYSVEISSVAENPFLIHPSYGTLVTAFPLDREITRSVILTVSATDQTINVADRRLDSLTAKIVILDINDNSPSFMSSSLSYVVEDAEVGFLVHHINAKDPDEGRNGQVTYHIISGNENKSFILDKITGTITSVYSLYTVLIMVIFESIYPIPYNTEIPYYCGTLPQVMSMVVLLSICMLSETRLRNLCMALRLCCADVLKCLPVGH